MSEKELKEINERLIHIEKICVRMDRHISFVDRTYESFEAPLSFIKQKFDLLLGTTKPLPIHNLEQVTIDSS